jgi:hypothetical protein
MGNRGSDVDNRHHRRGWCGTPKTAIRRDRNVEQTHQSRIATRIFLVAAMVAVLLTPAASAGKPRTLELGSALGQGQWDRTLEKYNAQPLSSAGPWVENPRPDCTWDINDWSSLGTTGDLAAGAAVTESACQIEGYNPMYVEKNGMLAWWSGVSPWFGVAVDAPSPSLSVKVCYSPQARCFTLSPVALDSRTYRYRICTQVVYTPDDPSLSEIPGSTPVTLPTGSADGRGVVTTITFTVSNPAGRVAKGVAINWGVSSDAVFTVACPSHNAAYAEYPFRWF